MDFNGAAEFYTYISGDTSETILMQLFSDIVNSWNKTHSGFSLVEQ